MARFSLARPAWAATLILCVLFSLLPAGQCDVERPRYVALTILHTNDLHGHLFPFDYRTEDRIELDVGGAARRAALIRKIDLETKHPVLVLDAGDAFARGPIADLEGKPDFDVMNAIGDDAMTLGNNEFRGAPGERGMQIVSDRIKQADFTILSANLLHAATGKTFVAPYTVLDLDGVRVGVFGLTIPKVAGYPQCRGLQAKDPLETAAEVVSELEGKADVIIALTHIGYLVDLQLAARLPSIDAIIGGDSHTWLYEPQLVKQAEGESAWWVGGPIVCQAGEWGRCLGRLDLRLRRSEDGGFQVMSYTGKLLPVDSSIQPAADVEHKIARWSAPFLMEVGELDQRVPLENAPSWLAERLREAAGAQVGLHPATEVESGLPAGRVSMLDIRKMYPWHNRVVRLSLSGATVKQCLATGEAAAAGASLRDGTLYVGESAADEGATYTVAMPDYFAAAWPPLGTARAEDVGVTVWEAAARFIKAAKARPAAPALH